MPQRTLRFRIRQDGLVEETVEGMTGSACLELTEKLESVLGSVQHRRPTADSYLHKQIQTQNIPAEIH